MIMEIAAIPPTMPPAMAPAFEVCPPTGVDVAVFEDPTVEAETGTEELEGPSTVPGPSSGESMKVSRGVRQ
jgi:hypothetical protein